MKIKNFAFFGVMAAIFATANAYAEKKIASTNYVDSKIQTESVKGTYEANPQTPYAEGTIGAAIKDISSTATDAANKDLSNLSDTGKDNIASVGKYSSSTSYTAGTIGKAIHANADDIAALQSNMPTKQNKSDSTVAAANTHGILTAGEGVGANLEALASHVSGAESDIDALQSAVNALDSATGDYELLDNKKTTTLVSTNDNTGNLEVAAGSATDYSATSALSSDFGTLASAINVNKNKISENASQISSVGGRVTTAEGDIDALESASSAAASAIASNASAITALQNAASNYELVEHKANTALATENNGTVTVAAGDSTAYPTTKAVTDALTAMKAGYTAADSALDTRVTAAESAISSHTTAIASNATDIDALQSAVDALESATTTYPEIDISTPLAGLDQDTTQSGCSTSNPCVLTFVGMNGTTPVYNWTNIAGLTE